MQLREFADYHRPALERDEVRHNLMLGLLDRLLDGGTTNARLWSIGDPGACAIQTSPQHSIILGELTTAQCRDFAEETLGLDYPGVVGHDETAPLFVEHAAERGVTFRDPIPQYIHALRDKPAYPGVCRFGAAGRPRRCRSVCAVADRVLQGSCAARRAAATRGDR